MGATGSGSRRGGRASSRTAKLTKNVAASIANASAGPPIVTATPPTIGPTVRARLRLSMRSALPVWCHVLRDEVRDDRVERWLQERCGRAEDRREQVHVLDAQRT